MPNRYNLPNIRTLLIKGFTADQLRRLCYDSPEFRPIYDQLTQATGKAEIINRLLKPTNPRQLDRLLTVIKARQPARYAAHQPYYERTELEAELAKVEQGLAAEENLRGILPTDQLEVTLSELRKKQAELQALLVELTQPGDWPQPKAILKGSGAIAQGKGATAAGKGGVVVDGPMRGNIVTGSQN